MKNIIKNKKILIITILLIVLIGIYLLYNTYALTTKVTNNDGYYTIELTDSNIVSLKANEEKTIIYQIKNTNNGTVSYGIAYNNPDIEVKVYNDSKDKTSGTIAANNNKFIKLHLKNTTSSNTTVEITAVMGYENGGDLIVPSNSTLVTETYTKPVSFAKYITNLYTNADKTKVTNNNIEYNYAPSAGLMNDRLGGTTPSLDGGNIRYSGAYYTTTEVATDDVYAWQTIGTEFAKEELYMDIEYDFVSEDDCRTLLSTAALPDCNNYSDYGLSSKDECEAAVSDYVIEATNNNANTSDGFLQYFCSDKIADKGEEMTAKKSINNYVYFNCEEYPSTNCELWRIVGVFDGKIKLIRNSSIGKYSWDTSASSVNSGYGVNEWSQADLMKLLNPGHESESVGGSLYYNSKSGTCYSEKSNATKSCYFTTTGIKNDTTRNMIAETTYNTGGWNTSDIHSNVIYEEERGTNVVSNPSDGIIRTTSWTGKIALPYLSDYGYAADLSKCSEMLSNYESNVCRINNWIYSILYPISNYFSWLLTPCPGNAYYVFYISTSGKVRSGHITSALEVAPVLYLNANTKVIAGDGSESNPYQLKA